MSRRMRDPVFRQGQRDGLYEPHVAPVNQLVDDLAGEGPGWLPHVAPVHGGVRARLLWVMRGPGVADPDHADTGFLCAENDDPTAERLCALLDRAGIDLADTVPWNASPWYVNRKPTVGELRLGAGVLHRLLELLPDVTVVLLFGREAERAWALLEHDHPGTARGLDVLATPHPGRQAFIGTAEQRERWQEEQALVVDRVGALLAALRSG